MNPFIAINLSDKDPILTEEEIVTIKKILHHGTEVHGEEMVQFGAMLGTPIPKGTCPSIIIGALVIGLKIQLQQILKLAREFNANEDLLKHAKDIVDEMKKTDEPKKEDPDNAV